MIDQLVSNQCGRNKEDITFERLKKAHLVAFFCPKAKFSQEEIDALKQYLETGGRLLFLGAEGGEHK